MVAHHVSRRISAHLRDFALDTPTAGNGLRGLIVSPEPEFRMVANNRVQAEVAVASYSGSLRYDWAQGSERIRRQRVAVLDLLRSNKKGQAPTAWTLVSLYYSAFFEAIELMRAFGRPQFFFDGSDIEFIESCAENQHGFQLQPGNYLGRAIVSDDGQSVEVDLGQRQVGAHQLVWGGVGELVALVLRRLPQDSDSWKPLALLGSILEANSGWWTPSQVRNRWNYRDPELFGKSGDAIAAEFSRLALQANSPLKWATRRVHPTDGHIACSLAFVEAVLQSCMAGCDPLFADAGN